MWHLRKLNDLLIGLDELNRRPAKNKLLQQTFIFYFTAMPMPSKTNWMAVKFLNENFILLSDNSLVSCFYIIFRVSMSTYMRIS